MSIEVLMPALSPTMEEGTLAKWLIKEGDSVESGDVIAEIETDKATMEVEAVEEGVVAKLLVAEGTEGVKVNAAIAILAEEGEDPDNLEAPKASSSSDDTSKDESGDDSADAAEADTDASDDTSTSGEPVFVDHSAPDASDPEIPSGTEMKETTVRDALRDAMAEEMRRDDTVFVMGEEVAEYELSLIHI